MMKSCVLFWGLVGLALSYAKPARESPLEEAHGRRYERDGMGSMSTTMMPSVTNAMGMMGGGMGYMMEKMLSMGNAPYSTEYKYKTGDRYYYSPSAGGNSGSSSSSASNPGFNRFPPYNPYAYNPYFYPGGFPYPGAGTPPSGPGSSSSSPQVPPYGYPYGYPGFPYYPGFAPGSSGSSNAGGSNSNGGETAYYQNPDTIYSNQNVDKSMVRLDMPQDMMSGK